MSTKPRYLTPRSAYFFRKVRQELVQRVLGQSVLMFPLQAYQGAVGNKYAQVYKENTKKVYGIPVRLPAVVSVQDKEETVLDEAFFEISTGIEVNFDREMLKQYGYFPNIGDIIGFQRLFFEVTTLDDSDMLQGSPEYKYNVKVRGVRSRISIKDLPLEKDHNI